LILLGSNPELGGETSDLMERLLAHVDLSRPLAAIVAPDADSERVNDLLESFEEWLGVEAGFLELDTDLEEAGWEESGMLLLEGDDPELWVEGLRGDNEGRLRSAFEGGSLILAVGGAACAFGSHAVSSIRPGVLVQALNWIPEAIVVLDPEEAHGAATRSWVRAEARRLVIRLESGSILALGPDGVVERWGTAAPEVLLGRGWGD
jgi:hypothetical protein